jgi:3-methylcrotonyl-CoA carboxylase alpha subunit
MLEDFYLPQSNSRDGPSRIDTGVEEGSEVTPFYDPMIAKLIVHREEREEAIEALATKLGHSHCYPVKWNAGFLRNLVLADDFRAERLDTGFIERNLENLIPSATPPADVLEAAGLLIAARASGSQATETTDIDDEWRPRMLGFRLNAAPKPTSVRVRHGAELYDVTLSNRSVWDLPKANLKSDGIFAYDYDGWSGLFTQERAEGGLGHHAHDGDIIAPMPGKVIAVDVARGQAVTAGQRLLVLEAMKMEHALTAPFDGVVTELSVSPGSQVQVEAVLAVVANPPPTGEGYHAKHGGGAGSE